MADQHDEGDKDLYDDESHEEEHRAPRLRPERNDPCWCGSGKKYKKCHLAADEEAERSHREPEPQRLGDPFYQILIHKVFDSAVEIRSRAEFREAYQRYFNQNPSDVDDHTANESGFFEWYIHDFRPGGTGRTLVEEYLRRGGTRLSARERALLESWLAARFGLFEIQLIEKGVGVELKDLFAGDQFFVHDVSTSRESALWDCIFTRVQDFEGQRIFTGNGVMVPRPLLSRLLAFVEKDSRAAGQPQAEFVRANSHRWYQVLMKLHEEQIAGMRMVNAEGDEMEFSSTTYRVSDEEGLMAALAAVKAFEDTTEEDDPPGVRHFGWLEPGVEGPRRSYGHIEIREGRLRLECNSRRRLKTGRQLLEKNARAFLKHEGDSFESVSEASERMEREGQPKKTATGIPPEVERELLLQFKTEHYAKWPDESLPALGGKTPRQAVKSEVGRRAVEDLLRQFENSEGRREDGQPPFDFSPLRKTLGLDR